METHKKALPGWATFFVVIQVLLTPAAFLLALRKIFEHPFPITVDDWVIVALIMAGILVLFGIYVGIQLYKLKPNALRLVNIDLGIGAALTLISIIILPNASSFGDTDIKKGMPLILNFFWYLYFRNSEKVKAAFSDDNDNLEVEPPIEMSE